MGTDHIKPNHQSLIGLRRHRAKITRRDFLRNATIGTMAVTQNFWGLDALSQANAKDAKMNPRLFSFVAGTTGPWKIVETKPVVGEALPPAERLNIVAGDISAMPSDTQWLLRGVTSNERYVTRSEKQELSAIQAGLGRPEADCAVLIPIRKNAKWWAMTQDERRTIFEEQSHHTVTGLKYLPAIARRLHHCRDLERPEPFDFLTWFEFAKSDTELFDKLLTELRATPEWAFVDREVEIRVIRQID
jgi:Chlorite dismutase